mgnify:CR=1 FL=1
MTTNKWDFEFTIDAQKKFKKLDKSVQSQVKKYIEKLLKSEDPIAFAKPLGFNLKNLWRFRIGNYRMICQIEKNELVILAIDIAHRKEIYEN